MSTLSRRDFLKVSGAFLGGLALSPFMPALRAFEDVALVRITTAELPVYAEPSFDALVVGVRRRDELVQVYREVVAEAPVWNPVWYRVWGSAQSAGYIHRAFTQRTRIRLNTALSTEQLGGKRLGEVTVPYTQSLRWERGSWVEQYRLYYESVHWVVGVEDGPDGDRWYRIQDELLEVEYIVPAAHLRIISDEELAPITPEIPLEKKRIEVDRRTQTLTAYEYDQPVFTTRVSTGMLYGPAVNGIPTRTPAGEFRIDPKMPTKHMGDGSLASSLDAYELVGVPWCCFFTEEGHAFHGAWWHDNFGKEMSHGCVNMRSREAKWLYLWALPRHVNDRKFNPGYGTLVRIF